MNESLEESFSSYNVERFSVYYTIDLVNIGKHLHTHNMSSIYSDRRQTLLSELNEGSTQLL